MLKPINKPHNHKRNDRWLLSLFDSRAMAMVKGKGSRGNSSSSRGRGRDRHREREWKSEWEREREAARDKRATDKQSKTKAKAKARARAAARAEAEAEAFSASPGAWASRRWSTVPSAERREACHREIIERCTRAWRAAAAEPAEPATAAATLSALQTNMQLHEQQQQQQQQPSETRREPVYLPALHNKQKTRPMHASRTVTSILRCHYSCLALTNALCACYRDHLVCAKCFSPALVRRVSHTHTQRHRHTHTHTHIHRAHRAHRHTHTYSDTLAHTRTPGLSLCAFAFLFSCSWFSWSAAVEVFARASPRSPVFASLLVFLPLRIRVVGASRLMRALYS